MVLTSWECQGTNPGKLTSFPAVGLVIFGDALMGCLSLAFVVDCSPFYVPSSMIVMSVHALFNSFQEPLCAACLCRAGGALHCAPEACQAEDMVSAMAELQATSSIHLCFHSHIYENTCKHIHIHMFIYLYIIYIRIASEQDMRDLVMLIEKTMAMCRALRPTARCWTSSCPRRAEIGAWCWWATYMANSRSPH